MNDKIQALAEKIYKDGVEKATEKADQIIASAQAKREEIIAQAQKEAGEIIAQANSEAEKEKERTGSEIRMSAISAKEALETEITNLLTDQSVTAGIEESIATPEALYNIIVKMSEQMIKEKGNEVTISTADAKQLTDYFSNKAGHLLEQGVKIESVQGTPETFDIAPKSGGYKLSVSKGAFINYFKEFLRPTLRELLFTEDSTKSEA